MDYEQYKSEVKKIEKANGEHLATFKKWLKDKKLAEKTINNHVNNVDFYINHYLNYYDPQEVKAGCYCIDRFLGNFFIRKAMWSSCPQIKANATSIKKFYSCMLEHGLVEKDDYSNLCEEIKEKMDGWLETMRRYEEDMDAIDMFDDLID